MDIESLVRAGTENDQKKHGTYKENFFAMRGLLRDLMVSGAANHETYQSILITLLSDFENVYSEMKHSKVEFDSIYIE